MKANRESRRKTGRTTRMIEEAKQLANAGRAVYIITATRQHARMLQAQIDDDTLGSGIQCETAPPGFDWDILRVPLSHPNCEFLVDHFAIEHKFRNVLAMLTRFDAQDASEKEVPISEK